MLVTETDELFKLVESSVLDTTVEMIRTGTALEIAVDSCSRFVTVNTFDVSHSD